MPCRLELPFFWFFFFLPGFLFPDGRLLGWFLPLAPPFPLFWGRAFLDGPLVWPLDLAGALPGLGRDGWPCGREGGFGGLGRDGLPGGRRRVGFPVGFAVASGPVGSGVGSSVGSGVLFGAGRGRFRRVGLGVCCSRSVGVDSRVGSGVNFDVGSGVGSGVGSSVGADVGFVVGSGVGADVGFIVDAGVGFGVGLGVGLGNGPLQSNRRSGSSLCAHTMAAIQARSADTRA